MAEFRGATVVIDYAHDRLRHFKATARLATEYLRTLKRLREQSQDFTWPILMLHGGADQVASRDGEQTFLQNINSQDKIHYEYPEAYHELHNDLDRDEVLRDILNWLWPRAL